VNSIYKNLFRNGKVAISNYLVLLIQ